MCNESERYNKLIFYILLRVDACKCGHKLNCLHPPDSLRGPLTVFVVDAQRWIYTIASSSFSSARLIRDPNSHTKRDRARIKRDRASRSLKSLFVSMLSTIEGKKYVSIKLLFQSPENYLVRLKIQRNWISPTTSRVTRVVRERDSSVSFRCHYRRFQFSPIGTFKSRIKCRVWLNADDEFSECVLLSINSLDLFRKSAPMTQSERIAKVWPRIIRVCLNAFRNNY